MFLMTLLCVLTVQNECFVEMDLHNFLEIMVDLWPPLLYDGQSSWLQIQRSGFDSQHYQIFWVVVGLGWGSLSLVSTNEELLERKSSRSGLENRDYGHKGSTTLTTWHPLYPQKAGTNLADKQRSLGWYNSPRVLRPQSFLLLICIP
jgi:hypothetical protein